MSARTCIGKFAPVALIAGLVFSAAAGATEPLTTITVTAGIETRTVVGRTDLGAPIEQVTLTRHVSYSDLDLATHSGASELKKRVAETARMACKQLDELYPLDEKQEPQCYREALAAASQRVDEAIAAAERGAKPE